MKSWTLALLLFIWIPHQIAYEKSGLQTDLPNVLIIGDSISLGYTPHVASLLENDALVVHHKGNAQHTGTGLNMLEEWLGETDWDVIQFNWGLWDLCYRHPDAKNQGNRDKINGTITTTLQQYEGNLEQLAVRLKETGAELIWANTTVVPEGEAGRFVGDDIRYNEVASRVMTKYDIAVTDLNTLTSQFAPDLFTAPGNVHFSQEGYMLIAEKVSEQIALAIQK